MKNLIILTLVFLTGCAELKKIINEPNVSPAPITRPEPKNYNALWSSLPNGTGYTQMTLQALEQYGAGLLSLAEIKDAEIYCPKYSKLDIEGRKQFYIYLISAMAQYESNFKPDTNYTECSKKQYTYKDEFYHEGLKKYCMKSSTPGEPIVSRGLLQISKDSSNNKKYLCNIKTSTELNDPKTNLECAVKILNAWIPADKHIGTEKLGGARYWSVLRPHSSSKPKIIEKMNSLEICK